MEQLKNGYKLYTEKQSPHKGHCFYPMFSAYTVAECCNSLPTKITRDSEDYWLTIVKDGDGWYINYLWELYDTVEYLKRFREEDSDKSLVNALAKMLIYLKKEGLLDG